MAREVINTPDAPSSPYYAQAIKAGNTVYVAGTTGHDPRTHELAGSIEEQTRQALTNCRAILKAAGGDLTDVVDAHVLLLQPEDAPACNDAFMSFFARNPPARSVGKLGVVRDGILVSVKMTAVLGD
jgi:2-iminobutanoate/2-iminopropanoate deaminase